MDSSSSDNEDPSASLLSETPPADDDVDDDPFEILARMTPSPDAVPWEQRSTKMKIVHVADRVFFSFLAIFFLLLCVEVLYILYHTVSWEAIFRELRNRLLTQEEGEEDFEL